MKRKRGGKVSGNDSDKKRSSDKGGRKKGGFHLPNFLSPLKKGAATGGKIAAKATRKTLNLLLRAGTLVLIAIIFCMLGLTFWKNAPAYGNIAAAVAQKNYILGAYLGVALFLLLVEAVTFLIVLFGSSTYGKRGHRYDKGKGWFSFIFIYVFWKSDPGFSGSASGFKRSTATLRRTCFRSSATLRAGCCKLPCKKICDTIVSQFSTDAIVIEYI